ncbi:protein neprosin [Quercus suber]|uniref:protein neprosin n=1 Tax=Quercus suber TaxID=58331 RepID=UPI0032DE5A1F
MEYAIVGTKNKNNVYHGGSASISLYNPKVKGTQYSSARIKVQNYPESIEVGWTVSDRGNKFTICIYVYPTLYNDTRTRLYTFTKLQTAKSSCFNTLCNSIIPVRTDIPLGIPLESISTPEQQFDLQLMLFWASSNGNWFLKFGQDETVIGFWPKNVFTSLGDGANYVEWGGEVFSPPGVPIPPMGSGYSERLKENTKYDAYCRQIKTINETDSVVNAVDAESFSDIVQYQVIDEE